MNITVDRAFDVTLRQFELEQRQNIIKRAAVILTVATIVGFGGDIGYIFSHKDPTKLLPIQAIVGIFIALIVFAIVYAIAYAAASRRNVTLASVLTVISCMLSVVGIQLVWIAVDRFQGATYGLDSQSWQLFMAYAVPIALAAVIGDNGLIYTTVAILNVISVAILLNAFYVGGQDLSTRHQLAGLLITALMAEWAVVFIILAMRAGFRRIVRHASDLQYAVERARRLDDLKDQFISSVNHELRNPVMALRGYLDALADLDPALPPERRQRFIAQAILSCQSVQELIESILSVRQIERGQGELIIEAVDIQEAVTIAAKQLDPREARSGERDLQLTIPPGLAVRGDRIRFQQVLTNLLSNAVKYSDPGTAIEVSAAVVGAEGDARRARRAGDAGSEIVEIVVRDHGFGIPPEQISLLFERFVRLPRDLGSTIIGNGLGLFLCRQFTEAMGGRIWVESTGIHGEGSAFHIQLPHAMESAVPAEASPRPVQASSRE
jgi:signal transduction histidine kinase